MNIHHRRQRNPILSMALFSAIQDSGRLNNIYNAVYINVY
jgi:hypothetical protein